MELSDQVSKMKDAKVAVHAITCENGGTAVVDRIKSRNPTMGFQFAMPIHSDPDRKLCAKNGEGFYVTKPMNAEEAYAGDYMGVNYTMVQPAMEVVDKTGSIVQKWSWLTMVPTPDPVEETTKVKTEAGSMLLVQARPQGSDILASIKEGRAAKLHASVSMARIIKSVAGEKVRGGKGRGCTLQ